MENDCVCILLAAYKGQKYIVQQLESIIAQSYNNWNLLVRVDGSLDRTEEIVTNYVQKDSRIRLLATDSKRVGASLNFGALMTQAETEGYPYIMFCDQDDEWKADKIEKSLDAIKELETEFPENTAVLVHTDFQYSDNNLEPIPTNENVAVKLSKVKDKLPLIANDNYIFGCTMILNLALLRISNTVMPKAENHDFWVALHASAFGKIAYLDTKTMLYRQHENNVSGGLKYSSLWNRLRRISNFEAYINDKRNRVLQFDAFYNKELSRFDEQQRDLLRQYLHYSKKGGFVAVLFMIRNGFKMRGILQTTVYYISLLLDRRN